RDDSVGAGGNVQVLGRHAGVHGEIEAQPRIVGGDRRTRVARALSLRNGRFRMRAQQVIAGLTPMFVCRGDVRLGADLRVEAGHPAAPVEQCQGHRRLRAHPSCGATVHRGSHCAAATGAGTAPLRRPLLVPWATAVLAPLTRSAGEHGPPSPGALLEGSVMVVTGLAFAAAAWGVLMGVSPVLQIRRMVRQRSSRDVSIGYFAVLVVGFVLWLGYGIAAHNLALIVPNGIALLICPSTIAVAVQLGHRTAGRREGTAGRR